MSHFTCRKLTAEFGIEFLTAKNDSFDYIWLVFTALLYRFRFVTVKLRTEFDSGSLLVCVISDKMGLKLARDW